MRRQSILRHHRMPDWAASRMHRFPTQEAKAIGDEFLQLEKYVNLNYMGFHKARSAHLGLHMGVLDGQWRCTANEQAGCTRTTAPLPAGALPTCRS